MKVYALVGKSGTGKSHHSMDVARSNKIDYIIDDGLLISDNRIIAGKSAKREKTKVASVRCAVFSDPEHAKNVCGAMKENNVESLLIIGTSVKMVNMIAEALHVLPIEKIIHIEEVSTPEDMQIAADLRTREGKHVIPVPTFEVKKQFSGYFVDPLMVFLNRKDDTIVEEKTVMRPTYSYRGEYKISPKAIEDICRYEASKFKCIYKVLKFKSMSTKSNRIIVDLDVSMRYPAEVSKQASEVSDVIKRAIEDMTSMNVKQMNINVRTLHIEAGEIIDRAFQR